MSQQTDRLWAEIEECEHALAHAKTYAGKEALRQRLAELSAEWRRS